MREKRTPCSNTDLPVSLLTCKLAWSNLVPDWYVHIINSSSSGMRRDFDSSKSLKCVLCATASARAD